VAIAVVAGALLYSYARRPVTTPAAPLRLTADLGADALLATAVGQNADIGSSVALSSDGTLFAFAARPTPAEPPQVYVRRLDELQATPLTGTEGAASPFFSPDGQWLAFFAAGKLKKISVTGSASITLCDAPSGRGGTWARNGTIVFTPGVNGPERFLWRVSSDGGVPEPLATAHDAEATQRWPQLLPSGNAILYTGSGNVGGYEDANVVVQPLPAGARKIVLSGGYYGRYVPSGHLVYIHFGTLYAVPFDAARLQVTGPPVAVLEGITSNPSIGATQFAVSDTGTIVYLPDRTNISAVPIQFMNASGTTTPLHAEPLAWMNPAFASDGRRLAMEVSDGKQTDVWVYEWARDALSRVTFDAADDERPVWAPDGLSLVFASRQAGDTAQNLYWQRADGSGIAHRLTSGAYRQTPTSWHPSGRFLAFQETRRQAAADIRILPMERTPTGEWKAAEPTDFVSGPFGSVDPHFSPDGRWLAYASNESGRPEVYVRPFPGPGAKWQVSAGGGNNPAWSQTRQELLFRALDNRIMVSSYTIAGDVFRADKPALWSETRFIPREPRPALRIFELHPDGEHVAIAGVPEDPTAARRDRVVFVFNFFDQLRRVSPTGN
jgi:Tol biopolymer transport system component